MPRSYEVRRRTAVLWIIATALIATVPWTYGSSYVTNQIAQIVFLALLAGSLNLLLGFAGELSVGQVAVTAVSAYTVAHVASELSAEIWITLPIGIVIGVVAGVLVGAPGLRLGAWSLAVVTLHAVIILPNAVNVIPSITGGFNGRYGIPQPQLFGHTLDGNAVFVVTVALFAGWTLLASNYVRSRHGAALHALRASPIVTTSVGVSTYRYKLGVYTLAAVPAALAGVLFVYRVQFVHPSPFSFHLLVEVIAVAILGGRRSVVMGPIAGAVLVQMALKRSADFADASLVVFGMLLLVFGMALPEGLTGVARRVNSRYVTRREPARAGGAAARDSPVPSAFDTTLEEISIPEVDRLDPEEVSFTLHGACLQVCALSKRFGGVRALNGVSLTAEPGQVTALIGGNGSGKTTLVNVASGYVKPDGGDVLLDGRSIAGRPPAELAVAGLRRTFQTPIIPDFLTTRQVIATARYRVDRLGALSAMLRIPPFRKVHERDARAATELIAACGLASHADAEATSLPLAFRRLIEVARALAGRPTVLLLDEPAAGLDDDELEGLRSVIERIRAGGMTVLLIEHNFEFVRLVADVVYVLDQGELLASGKPDEVASRADVQRRYFGVGSRHGDVPVAPVGSGAPS